MKFKKGSKVEVLSTRDVPSGSWFPAEIVSRKGYYYNVKYDSYFYDVVDAVEKVQSSAIRPCPPPMEKSMSCADGGIVEVFEYNSWKNAKIVNVIDGGMYYVVDVTETSKRIKIHNSNVRLRQSWIGGRWFFVDKVAEKNDKGAIKALSKKEKVNIRNHHQVSLRSLKKTTSCEFRKKIKVVKKIKKRRSLPEKVSVNASINNKIYRCMNEEKKLNFQMQYEDENDNDSIASSTGSCCTPLHSPYDQHSTGDSQYDMGNEIHKLELDAYHNVIVALHESGPLSWEQEVLLTNLRLNLHITNDEHLSELRKLNYCQRAEAGSLALHCLLLLCFKNMLVPSEAADGLILRLFTAYFIYM